MADIDNPQVRKFANERARIAADAIVTCYETLKRLQVEYDAAGGDTLFPATTDRIVDGSETDGRTRITTGQVRGLNTLSAALVTYLDGGTPSRISQVRQVAVNGTPRY